MKRIMGKLSPSQDLWGVNTDYPDCVQERSDEQSRFITPMVTKGKAQVHFDKGVVHVTCTSLRDVFPLAQHCYNFYTTSLVSIPTRPARLVILACDRL